MGGGGGWGWRCLMMAMAIDACWHAGYGIFVSNRAFLCRTIYVLFRTGILCRMNVICYINSCLRSIWGSRLIWRLFLSMFIYTVCSCLISTIVKPLQFYSNTPTQLVWTGLDSVGTTIFWWCTLNDNKSRHWRSCCSWANIMTEGLPVAPFTNLD